MPDPKRSRPSRQVKAVDPESDGRPLTAFWWFWVFVVLVILAVTRQLGMWPEALTETTDSIGSVDDAVFESSPLFAVCQVAFPCGLIWQATKSSGSPTRSGPQATGRDD